MELWLMWTIAGFALVIIEMLTGTFYLLMLGVGAFVGAIMASSNISPRTAAPGLHSTRSAPASHRDCHASARVGSAPAERMESRRRRAPAWRSRRWESPCAYKCPSANVARPP